MPATPITPSRSPRSRDGSGGRAGRWPGEGRLLAELGPRSLPRALLVSGLLHAFGVAFALGRFEPAPQREAAAVNVEIAPAPPTVEALPAAAAIPPEQVAAEANPSRDLPAVPDQHGARADAVDAGVDATVDAAPRRKRRRRPIPDAGRAVVLTDSGAADSAVGDAALREDGGLAAATGGDAASDSGTTTATSDPGPSSDSPGEPGVIGTDANLLSYFPPRQVVTALVRFDRLRGTEWANAAEAMLRSMPDYRALFGDRDAEINRKIDVLAISSAKPRDATATTLVIKTPQSRANVRELLANSTAPIAWSASRGGLLGTRGGDGSGVPNTAEPSPKVDQRVLLSPWTHWYLLAAPSDLGGLTTPASGNLDRVEAKGKLPTWLASIRAIETESGGDKRGPALVVTLGRAASGSKGRISLPELGLGVRSLPVPTRVSIAMELVTQGWLVRGTMQFSTEAEASEFVESVRGVQHRVSDSLVLSAIVARQHGRSALEGLSLLPSGAGVSYATSLSISDARGLLATVAATLAEHFGSR